MLQGKWIMTRAVAERMKNENFALFITDCMNKYLKGDWGDTCQEDWKQNDNAVRNSNDRIVARYDNIFFITEWDRSVTTILFTEEY